VAIWPYVRLFSLNDCELSSVDTHTDCLSNAMHGQNINLPVCVCVCVCPSHFLSTRLKVRPLNGFLQLIA